MKKQSDLSRLMEYAGKHKYFTYASWVFAAISAFVALLPFIYIWKIVKEVLDVAPNFSEATELVKNKQEKGFDVESSAAVSEKVKETEEATNAQLSGAAQEGGGEQ